MVITITGERCLLIKYRPPGTKIQEIFHLGYMLYRKAVVKFVVSNFLVVGFPPTIHSKFAVLDGKDLMKLIAAIESGEIPLSPLGEDGKPTGMEKVDAIHLLNQALDWVAEPDPDAFRSVKLSW
jgi:hypothetical protein